MTLESTLNLDQIDLHLLEVLQQDAALENQEIAKRVHLSAAACLRRVRRLRDAGVVSRVVALVDADRVGLHVRAYAFVSLDQRPSAGAQFRSMVLKRREVVECVRLSGTHDFMLKIAVHSIKAYSEFLDAHVLPLPAVRSINTSFELDVLKSTTALPVAPQNR